MIFKNYDIKKINLNKNKIILFYGQNEGFKNEAINIFDKAGNENFAILHCNSMYPTPPDKVFLGRMEVYKKMFDCPVGFSDHTLGSSASFAAASVGASVIEKHFTLSRKMYGSDAKNSMEPDEFKLFSKTIKEIWHINKCDINKNNIKKFKDMKMIFEKSIYAKSDLLKGHRIKFNDLSFKKPCKYLRADKYKTLIGKVLVKTIKKDEPINVKNIKK